MFDLKCSLKQRSTRVSSRVRLAALFVFAAIPVLAIPALRSFTPSADEAVSIHNSKEYKRLRSHACTKEDFNALARYSQARVEKYWKDQAGYDLSETSTRTSQPSTFPNIRRGIEP
jgi:hypothetical protein